MSVGKRIAFAVSASWLSRFITITLGLVLMPVLFKHLGQEELGLWFMLGQSGAFLGLMDMGISPTLTRRIALAKGKSGGDPSLTLSEESQQEISDLVATGRVIYRVLTVGVFCVAWTSGFVFISQIELTQLTTQAVWIAWTVMCLSHAVGIWASRWSSLLQGMGYVGWDSVLATVIGVATLLIQIAVVFMGGGLVSLAVVAALGAILNRLAMFEFIRRREPGLFSLQGRWSLTQFKSMTAPALKAWLTVLGAFLTMKTDQYFIAYFHGVGDIPAYHASFQIVSNLFVLATVFANMSGVFVSQLWQSNNLEQIHKLVQRNLRLGLSVMVCGAACLLLAGESLINLWLGQGHFVGFSVLAVFCLTLTLDAQQVIVISASRATEDEVFALCALLAGILNLTFTWLLIEPFGLLGVALGTLFAQILTNNWYTVYRGLWRLKMSRIAHLQQVVVPITVVFLAALGFGWLGLQAIPPTSSNVTELFVCIMITGFVLVLSIWKLVLGRDERLYMLRRVRSFSGF